MNKIHSVRDTGPIYSSGKGCHLDIASCSAMDGRTVGVLMLITNVSVIKLFWSPLSSPGLVSRAASQQIAS
eukprot:311116-Pelagomonas_calceolata.AAC.3